MFHSHRFASCTCGFYVRVACRTSKHATYKLPTRTQTHTKVLAEPLGREKDDRYADVCAKEHIALAEHTNTISNTDCLFCRRLVGDIIIASEFLGGARGCRPETLNRVSARSRFKDSVRSRAAEASLHHHCRCRSVVQIDACVCVSDYFS